MTRENTTTESPFVLSVALGDTWRRWHHAFTSGCAASELRPCQQWNPTELFIDACTTFGLVTGRRSGIGCWALRERKWLNEVHAAGCVNLRIEQRERLAGWQMFCMRELDMFDSPPLRSQSRCRLERVAALVPRLGGRSRLGLRGRKALRRR